MKADQSLIADIQGQLLLSERHVLRAWLESVAISNRLKARVIIYACHDHVWLLSPESLVVKQLKSTRVKGSQNCYEIRWVRRELLGVAGRRKAT